jgi:polyferredoxin
MFKKILQKLLPFGFLGTVTLVQPACAAVCPRGIGGCVYPGRCFLFTDADGNSLCDYTRTAITQPTQNAVSVAGPTTVPPVADATQVVQILPHPATTGVPDLLHFSPLITGIVLFLAICGIFFWIFKSGRFGIKAGSTSQLVVLSSLFSLGIAEIVVCLLMVGNGQGTIFALVYILSGLPLATYLWMTGTMSRPIALILLLISTVAGFIFLSPIMPLEFTALVSFVTGKQSLAPGIIAILVILATTLFAGRMFCAHLCPVGTIQELASLIPLKKFDTGGTKIPEIIRFMVFIAAIACGVYFINLMEFTGVYDLFSITITTGFFIFAALLVISFVVYRPVCRFLCPFGVIFSLIAHFSSHQLRRTDSCISCKKCEKVCPVHVAGKGASKRECYLCGRCIDVCPVTMALGYGKQ